MLITDVVRLGIIGISDGNGHPYSWSAIFNGYDKIKMKQCPFPAIPEYLSRQSFPEDFLTSAKVTHIWTQDKKLSRDIASSTYIENIVDNYQDMIGEVDAILLARDDAENHFIMSKPFLEKGIPVYIDKPISLDLLTLNKLLSYEKYPGQIFSCSPLRYSKEFNLNLFERMSLGAIEYVEARVSKHWETYGVHLVDPLLNMLCLDGQEARIHNLKFDDKKIVIAKWPEITINFTILGGINAPIRITLYGKNKVLDLEFQDAFFAFKQALTLFIEGFVEKKYIVTHKELRGVVSIIQRGNE